jgi:hypothetical protein
MNERQCGDCTLCCKLLPVSRIGKPANTRCVHQRHGRCKAYASLWSVSPDCKLWSCRWLTKDGTNAMSRPDRSHYVIDIMPDYIKAWDGDAGDIREVPVVQIWVDPDYPDAHRDPALRAWIDRTKQIALVRIGDDGLVLFPPSRMDNRQWLEKGSIKDGEPPHSVEDVHRVLTGGVA